MSNSAGGDRQGSIVETTAESTPCEACGNPVRFDTPDPYYKTADERFWHKNCWPETEGRKMSDGVDQKVQFKTIGPGVRRAVDEEAGVVLYRLFSPQSVQYEQGGAAVPIDQTELGDSE